MTINMVADLQKYRVSNTYNVGVEYYSDGDCLLDLDEMLASWLVQLRGQRKSKHTQRIYRTAVQSFLAFCDEYELPRALTKPAVLAYMASRSGEASTAQLHLRVLKLFAVRPMAARGGGVRPRGGGVGEKPQGGPARRAGHAGGRNQAHVEGVRWHHAARPPRQGHAVAAGRDGHACAGVGGPGRARHRHRWLRCACAARQGR